MSNWIRGLIKRQYWLGLIRDPTKDSTRELGNDKNIELEILNLIIRNCIYFSNNSNNNNKRS